MIVARDIRSVLCERQIGPPIMVSIGIALLTGEEEVAADDILTRAQIALYEAKELGGDQARVFTGQATGALTWVQRIRTALAEDRFVLYGQPIADLRTGRITHHELLVRMLSEDGDIIPPAAFLPMAERFGVIGEIDRWVTTPACGWRSTARASRSTCPATRSATSRSWPRSAPRSPTASTPAR